MIRSVLLVLFLAIPLAAQDKCTGSNIPAKSCGSFLAMWPATNGQSAYSNGNGQGTPCSCAGGLYYQCTEYVTAYYSNILHVDTSKWSMGNAKDYYANAVKNGLDRFPDRKSVV